MKDAIDQQRRLFLGSTTACFLLAALPARSAMPAAASTQARRVVVAGGALTEIVYALDAGAFLIGADTSSTYPAAAMALPKMGYQRALSAEGVLSLHPDLLLASADAGPPTALQQIAAAGVRVIRLGERHEVNTVREKISGVASALARPERGELLLHKFDQQWQAALASATQQRKGKPPRVLFILSNNGSQAMAAGQETAADAMIRYAGGVNATTNLAGKGFKGYKPLTAESAVASGADVLLMSSESLATIGGVDRLLSTPGLALTPAAKTRRVVADMDTLLLLGFGLRLPQALTQLVSQLYV